MKRTTFWKSVVGVPIVMAACVSAVAETPWDFRPIAIDDGPTDARTAYVLEDVEKGYIGYHHARPDAPALWCRVEGRFGSRLQLQIGVPTLDRYRLLRPAIAVLGPGLPAVEEEIPFEIPEGYGGRIYKSADLDIHHYTDKYTGVISWRFDAVEHVLESTGRYYVVGYIPLPLDPEARDAYPDGKFWMTTGHKVNFRMADLFKTYKQTRAIRDFFETAVTQSQLYRNGILFLVLSLLGLMFAVA